MKRLILILSLFLVSISYATNLKQYKKENLIPNLSAKYKSHTLVGRNNAIFSCSTKVTSTTKTNADGSTTRTTITTVNCDTPSELAEFHALMKSIGMGV